MTKSTSKNKVGGKEGRREGGKERRGGAMRWGAGLGGRRWAGGQGGDNGAMSGVSGRWVGVSWGGCHEVS